MVKKKKNKKRFLLKSLFFIIKIPYYGFKGISFLVKKSDKVIKKKRVMKKRSKLIPVYEDIKLIQSIEGNYKKWENSLIDSDSKIGVILGARGSGKTAFGIKFLENLHAKTGKDCYAIGFKEEEMPSWIKIASDISQLTNDSFVLVDEGGILFSSRNSMSSANKFLSELILVARHKNLNIFFISQNSSNLDVNILRQSDFLILKPSSLLQKNFERKIIQKIYEEESDFFEKFKENKGLAYIYGDSFKGFISNPLPSFWTSGISKSFR
ncbi:hypothetical protein GF386_00130 [Candidatus Pacearchaeota archaeon]|nr:hypothetical protein [Candidatus Pacearchaeota archaeon]MBD3282689.1 hypothetical protein [Candidatus Pacearchaeota archaeon]